MSAIAVLLGALIITLMIVAEQELFHHNYNVFWLLPAQLIFLTALFFKGKFQRILVNVAFVIIAGVAIIMNFWPQETELSFLFLALIFTIRYLFHNKLLEGRKNKRNTTSLLSEAQ